ncbi:MAG: GGDEF domain-containing protein [Halioglobus sp.]|nr:GGDEF domain-containing protein [Halioglobus sp.]
MDQISLENWVVMHLGLIFMITCAQILVVYALSDASNPTAGLGMYTVYFMAALLGWLAFALQQGSDIPMAVDVPSVASILNSYILFLAAGQRAGIDIGRFLLGLICLFSCLSVFFLPPQQMFAVQMGTAGFFFAGTGLLCGWRSWNKHNVGDAITAIAALLMVVGIPLALYQWLSLGDYLQAQAVAFGVYSCAYVLVVMGFLASVVIEYQQHLSHLATVDPLTRLLNHRGLEQALHITLAHAARQQLPTAAIMVDIDHFKELNDNFGHEAGDQVIRQIAQYLQGASRASDVVARTGGGEFLLILPHTDPDGARLLAESIRKHLAEQPLVVNQQSIPVTVSLGVASAVGEIDLDNLSREADRAMYLAKRGGRNQVASVEHNPIHLSTNVSQA